MKLVIKNNTVFVFLFFIGSFFSYQVAAQSITLSEKNISLEKVFQKIEKQSGYLFVYRDEWLQQARKIDINVINATLDQVLTLCFKGQPLTYEIVEKNIVIKQKPEIKKNINDIRGINESLVLIDVKGKVINENGEPVAATVSVKGTKVATPADTEGNFFLKAVDNSATLVISGVGIETREVKINNRTELSINVKIKVTKQEEVIINAGYYNVIDKERTGSISRIDAKIIEKQPVSNPLQTMQGRMPGIYITQYTGVPGSNFQVRIRGTNSLASGNNPLYLIDGVPFISETLSGHMTGRDLYGDTHEQGGNQIAGTSPLNALNPNDIESIEILKDADATAIYGSRGANGVILITTKKGKAGKLKVDINIKSGISKVSRRIKLLNTEQYISMRMQAVTNDGNGIQSTEYDINGTWDMNRYTDWQKVLIGGSAKMTDVNASISAGNNETQFLFSAGYNDQGTVFLGDDLARRFSTHFSVSHTTPNKKFNTRLSTSYSINNSNIVARDLTLSALLLAPNAPKLYDANGKINWENSTWQNPLAELENRFTSNTYNLLTNVELGFEIIKGLRFKANVGLNDIRNAETQTNLSTSTRPSANFTPSNYSSLSTGTNTTRSWIAEPQMNYETKVGKGKLAILIGGTYQYRESEVNRGRYKGFPSNALIYNRNSATSLQEFFNGYSEYKYAAVYGRANYNWDEKYILNITGRRDGSSRFGPGRKFANLGAAGFAWIFSNENFATNNIPFLSFGKLRGSYGLTGNDQIGDYLYLDTYGSGTQYQGISTLGPTQLFNPDFGWEVNKKLEGAIDLGFLNDRILFTAAYFSNRSSNQLVSYRIAGTTGFSSVLQNFQATVQNKGLEIELATVNFIRNSFKWTTSLNITFPRNELVSFPNLQSSSYANTYIIGKPLNIQKAYHYLGVDPATGFYHVEDVNGDGQFNSEDKKSVFEFVQNFYGGISNNLSFKGVQLDIFFQFVNQKGQLPYFGAGGGKFDPVTGYGNIPAMLLGSSVFDGRWHSSGDHATRTYFTRSAAAEYPNILFANSDAVEGEISFIRLKNISISYQVPDKLLRGVKGRIYLQGQNLLTFTNYTGLDPETGSFILPPLTTYVAGLQITF